MRQSSLSGVAVSLFVAYIFRSLLFNECVCLTHCSQLSNLFKGLVVHINRHLGVVVLELPRFQLVRIALPNFVQIESAKLRVLMLRTVAHVGLRSLRVDETVLNESVPCSDLSVHSLLPEVVLCCKAHNKI